jgi:inorganic pyrophosphatase
MNLLTDLPLQNDSGEFHVVVEVPRGSTVKLKYQPNFEAFTWSRALPFGLAYPYDYGFFPRTISGDEDAIDAMVLADVPSYPGVVVPSRIIGALRVTQDRPPKGRRRNDRVIVVPVNEHRYGHIRNISDLPDRVREEIEAFFQASLVLTGKTIEIDGWADASEATASVLSGGDKAAKTGPLPGTQ